MSNRRKQKQKKKKTKLLSISIGILLLLIVLLTIGYLQYASPGKAIAVTTERVSKKNIESSISTSGTVTSNKKQDEFANGTITNIFVSTGDKVTVGTNLFEIQDTSTGTTSTITAKIDGTVTQINYSINDTVISDEDKQPIISINNLDDIYVSTEIPSSQIEKVKTEQKAKITIGDKTYNGTVNNIDLVAKQTTTDNNKYFTTKVKIDDPTDISFLGVDASVDIITATIDDTLSAPIKALSFDSGRPIMYKLDTDKNKVKKVYVELGIQNEINVQILSGLKDSDEVVTFSNAPLYDSAHISIK